MRSFHYTLLFLCLLPNALRAQTEIEPNDVSSQANFWAENSPMTGTCCYLGGGATDEDWYMIVPAEQGALTIAASVSNNTTGTHGIQIHAFFKDGTTLYWNTNAASEPTPFTSQTTRYCSGADTIFVQVNAELDNCEYYTLTYTVAPPLFANDVEDNDDLAHATPVAENTWTEGRVGFAYDDGSDYYGMVLPQTGNYTVTMEAAYQTDGTNPGTIDLQLLDGNGNLAGNMTAQEGANTMLSTTNEVTCAGPGTYYLHVFQNGFTCGESYRLNWQLEPAVFANDVEPNNTSATAAYFPPDVPQSGVLSGTDNDWWKLYKTYTGDLQLTVSGALLASGSTGMAVQIFNPAMQLLYNGGIFPGADNVAVSQLITVAASVADTFYVDVFYAFPDCGSYQLSYSSAFLGIASQGDDQHGVAVSPNPSSDGRFRLSCPRLVPARLIVQDASGRSLRDDVVRASSPTIDLDLSSLDRGIYLVSLFARDGSVACVRVVRD